MQFLPIVLTCDDPYFKYASVVVKSIIENRNKDVNYEINILSEGISEENRRKMEEVIRNYPAFSIKYHNLDNVDTDAFHLNSYMSVSTYYRFFISEIFPDYERILYLDCDLIVDADISALATMDFEGKLAICCSSPYVEDRIEKNDDPAIPREYFSDVLGMGEPLQYFNAGVMLYNLKMLRENHIQQKLFSAMKEIPKPIFQDQDLLNAVFSKNGGVKLVSQKYNFTKTIKISPKRLLLDSFKKKLGMKKGEPWFYIYHYVGKQKPWQKDNVLDSGLFFKYAYKTPFYKEIINANHLDKARLQKRYRLSWL